MRLLKCGIWAAAISVASASSLAANIYRCDVAAFSDSGKMPKEFLFRFNKPLTRAEILGKDLTNLSSIGVKRHSINSVVMSWTRSIQAPTGIPSEHADRIRVVFNVFNLKVSVQLAEANEGGKLIRGAGGCHLVKRNRLYRTYRQIAGVI